MSYLIRSFYLENANSDAGRILSLLYLSSDTCEASALSALVDVDAPSDPYNENF